MRIVLVIVGVVVGIIVGSVVMLGIHFASLTVYPVPEGIDMLSMEPEMQKKVAEWMSTLPTGAWLFAWLAHAVGCLSAAVVAMLVAGRRSVVPAVVIGVWFTIGGIWNGIQLQAPAWFFCIDVPVYLLGAFAVGKWLKRSPTRDA